VHALVVVDGLDEAYAEARQSRGDGVEPQLDGRARHLGDEQDSQGAQFDHVGGAGAGRKPRGHEREYKARGDLGAGSRVVGREQRSVFTRRSLRWGGRLGRVAGQVDVVGNDGDAVFEGIALADVQAEDQGTVVCSVIPTLGVGSV
jgi:hypothetical protein